MSAEYAVVVHATGAPDALRYDERDPGQPGPGEVRVRVSAAGVNFIDVYHREGRYPRPLPFVAGMEGAGIVEGIGEGVTGLAAGDRVAWASVPGSYATAVIAPADRLVRVPESVAPDTAAAVMLQGMTAHYLTHATHRTQPGDVALVHAAAGGVGLLLVQMLKHAGAEVIATCGTQEKADLASAAGADHVINYRQADFTDEVRRITGRRGADVVYDGVGQATFEGSLRSLRPRGLMVLFGASSGAVPPFELTRLNDLGSLFVTRPSLAHYTANRAELELRSDAVFSDIVSGRLSVRIGARYPFSRAAEAHRALEARETSGKVLLVPEER
jgi:NADPH2:quinone reductase